LKKKNQKTFSNWATLYPEMPQPDHQKFFAFFSKKKAFLRLCQNDRSQAMPSLPRIRKNSWSGSILVALALWAATRLIFLAIGAYSFRLNGDAIPWVNMWVQWDSGYYLSIAKHGYQLPIAVTGSETGQSNINFFPFTAILIAAVHVFVRWWQLAGVVAANICLLIAAAVLHRLSAVRYDINTADWSVLSLMALPGSFALSGPLSEAPFLVLSISAAYFAGRRSSMFAVSSGLLTITRLTGIFQGMGFALDWLIDRARGKDATYRRFLPICLIPLPLLVLLVYMFALSGDALAPLHSNVVFWRQEFGIPFHCLFLFATSAAPQLEIQSAVALILLLITLSQAWRFSYGELFFLIASVASFSSSGSASPSLIRYTIGLYPVHIAVGRLCGRHSAVRLLCLCLALAGAAIAAQWFRGTDLYV
jgi:hypothetical protein